MSTAATRTSSNVVPFPSGLEEKIRRRAYEIFLGRGATHGHALDDWLQAEAELIQPAPKPAAAGVRRPRTAKK